MQDEGKEGQYGKVERAAKEGGWGMKLSNLKEMVLRQHFFISIELNRSISRATRLYTTLCRSVGR